MVVLGLHREEVGVVEVVVERSALEGWLVVEI